MWNASSRRAAADKAIQEVLGGSRAGDVESETIDFKEEVGSVARGGRRPINPHDEPAARDLAAAAACFANSPHGGVIVVGVDDKRAGEAAFVGAHLDTDWLRMRIHELTHPRLTVDEIEEVEAAGARIYLINVAPALAEIYCDGKLRTRLGTTCTEMSGDDARRLLEQRRHFDWSAEPSGMRLSGADPEALAVARDFYVRRSGAPMAIGDPELSRRLGIALDESDDPVLNRAGAVLLCRYEEAPGLDVQVKPNESTPSAERADLQPPLLTAIADAWDRLDRSFPAEERIQGLRRRKVRNLPQAAAREALVNAVSHRDYRLDRSPITVRILGSPARSLVVVSPGSLPEGVRADRLISTLSRPRNRRLASALRVLGLGEGEGIGIDRMYGSMLQDGHALPEITDDGGTVTVRLRGGRPDLILVELFEQIGRDEPEIADDVRVSVAIDLLRRETPLRPERLAEAAQCPIADAFEVLATLERLGVLVRVANRARAFRLSPATEALLGERVRYTPKRALDDHWERIRAFLDSQPVIGRSDAAKLLDVTPQRATQVLSALVKRGDLVPHSNARGRAVRYRTPRGND